MEKDYEALGQRRAKALLSSVKQAIDEVCDEFNIHQCHKDVASGWCSGIGYWAINDPKDE